MTVKYRDHLRTQGRVKNTSEKETVTHGIKTLQSAVVRVYNVNLAKNDVNIQTEKFLLPRDVLIFFWNIAYNDKGQ